MEDKAEITISGDDKNVIITGKGALDLTNSQEFRVGLAEASTKAESLVVDLREATFIDTAILEYLARATAAMNRGARQFKILVTEKSHPIYVLRTVGFTEIINIEVHPMESGPLPEPPH